MVQFNIQPDSEIPASTQLLGQICFAIASGQLTPGHRLPSTRQLAMQTGLHRNTISKVYERLEALGLVEAQVGSGIYVRALEQEPLHPPEPSPLSLAEQVEVHLEELLHQGYSLAEVRDALLLATTKRLHASSQVWVTVPQHDLGAGEIMVQELQKALSAPIELVFLEELESVLTTRQAATIVTVRFFASQAEAILKTYKPEQANPTAFRIVPIDIYSYSKELELVKTLPEGSRLGLVSLSSETLGLAEVIIYSLRGDSIYLLTAQCHDKARLRAMIRQARTIICDQVSYQTVKAAIAADAEQLIRPPQVIGCESYIDPHSIELLKRELGLEP
ncbi:GntR family transcriptional regulator [Synechococcales cyanobacterium C]|uniref:GntR family transcriptional regulator n=1 Tax=Petrachloros mirabilis ULC683 TaxID=2781853 RepID=A0A8K1ZYY7_9CYAN|nr:GntR family transcriptional regulator [Petrachloros mirabilis]NCJ07739.1 GntR family transcriptional regulator [Petrachloros mirabilis ULC683]